MQVTRKRRTTAIASAVAVGAATIGVGLLTAPVASAGTNGLKTYESDCTTTLQPGVVAPFITAIQANAAPDPSFPTSGLFGATGAYSVNISGAFIAGLAVNGITTSGLVVGADIGGINATGTYHYAHTFPSTALGGTVVAGAGTTIGSTTVTGAFGAGDAGKFISMAAIPQGSVIIAVNPGVSATITQAATATSTASAGLAGTAGVNYTDVGFSTGSVFTTNGTNGGTSEVNFVASTGFQLTTNLVPVGFGPDYSAGCTVTGYDGGGNPGPGQAPAPGPALPQGTVSALNSVAPVQTAGFAFVDLVDDPPAAQAQNVNMGVGGSGVGVTLTATTGDATGANGFQIVGAPSDPRLQVTGLPNGTGAITLADLGPATTPQIVTFQFRACDDGPAGTNCGAAATVTVNIGTPPVDQEIDQQVNGGQLVLSCSAPGSALYPLLDCPIIALPAINLNGTQQTATGAMNSIYVSDNRGNPAVGWTLTSYMIPAAPYAPSAPAGCNAADFCNTTVGANLALPVNHIPAGNLNLLGTCATVAGNVNPTPATNAFNINFTGAGQTMCQATAGVAGGTFNTAGNFTLTVPSSQAAGSYVGVVEYLVV